MPRTVTKDVYQFDELNDRAKEKARDWFKGTGGPEDFDGTIEDFVAIAELLGVTFRQRNAVTVGGRQYTEPCIFWSLSYSQGDGACFEGRYAYAKGGAAKLKEHAPTDEVLHKIADDLEALQAANGFALTAKLDQSGGNYTHSGTVDADVWKGSEDDDDFADEDTRKALLQIMRRLMDWLYKELVAADEDQRSDETVDENIRINDYEFEADGTRTRD